MSESIRLKDASPLVKTVVALDAYFENLARIGAKLDEIKIKSDSDVEQARKFLARFAECGQGITDEVTKLSTHLNDARARASEIAERVGAKADEVNARSADENIKLEQFRRLGEKVRELNVAISELRTPADASLSSDERQVISSRLLEFDTQLVPLIDEAQGLLKYAQEFKIKYLEQNADSLAQTLQSVRKKIRSLSIQP
jgi:chromosome segregation ATPase